MTKEQILEELTSIRDYMDAKGAVVGNGQITALIEKLNGTTEPLKSAPAIVNPLAGNDKLCYKIADELRRMDCREATQTARYILTCIDEWLG